MEFAQRGLHQQNNAATPAGTPAPASGGRSKVKGDGMWSKLSAILLVCGGVLLLAVLFLIVLSKPTTEAKYVQTDKYQAVFLNGGTTSGSFAYTTYFGHVTKLTGSYVVLNDVYFLTTPTATDKNQTANSQLTKLGCQQLHSPTDQIVINMNQVAYWENLQDSGKVVQAIQQFQKENPNGPNCTASTNSGTSTGTSTQDSTSTQTNQ